MVVGNQRPGVVLGDVRELRDHFGSLWPKPEAIITSPPYLNLQDYGVAGQIGCGQSDEEYLNDMRGVFEACAEISTDDAAMWLVVGMVRRSGELIQLPALLAQCARSAGWVQREEVTWEKGKSLPWTKRGEFRDVTEQALLFSKTEQFRFNVHELLSPEPRSTWWRRYPERYSPSGRLPTNLWSIPIPTQGSWRDGPNHVCPFPHELTYRMVSLITAPGGTVVDPFAGVGSVPAMANVIGRKGYGVELNDGYVARYADTLEATRDWFKERSARNEGEAHRRREFRRLIVELRLLKYARLVGNRLVKQGLSIAWLRVRKRRRAAAEPFKIVVADFEIAVTSEHDHGMVVQTARAIARKAPLSKFGIEAHFVVTAANGTSRRGHWYEGGKFWLTPVTTPPIGTGPHVVAHFRPNVEDFEEPRPAT